jgi:predicted nucleotidyltransferase
MMWAQHNGASMNEHDRQIALQLKRRLSQVVPLLDYRVFGSRARGDADEYSDLDVFLEIEYLTKDLREKISDLTWEVGFENKMVISTLVFTRDELENTPLRSSPIVQAINEEGVRV